MLCHVCRLPETTPVKIALREALRPSKITKRMTKNNISTSDTDTIKGETHSNIRGRNNRSKRQRKVASNHPESKLFIRVHSSSSMLSIMEGGFICILLHNRLDLLIVLCAICFYCILLVAFYDLFCVHVVPLYLHVVLFSNSMYNLIKKLFYT